MNNFNSKLGVYTYAQNESELIIKTKIMEYFSHMIPRIKDVSYKMVFDKIKPLLKKVDSEIEQLKDDIENLENNSEDNEIQEYLSENILENNNEMDKFKDTFHCNENLIKKLKLQHKNKDNNENNFQKCVIVLNQLTQLIKSSDSDNYSLEDIHFKNLSEIKHFILEKVNKTTYDAKNCNLYSNEDEILLENLKSSFHKLEFIKNHLYHLQINKFEFEKESFGIKMDVEEDYVNNSNTHVKKDKKNSFSVGEKLKALEEYDRTKNYYSVARNFNTSSSAIFNWDKNRQNIKKIYDDFGENAKRCHRGGGKPKIC